MANTVFLSLGLTCENAAQQFKVIGCVDAANCLVYIRAKGSAILGGQSKGGAMAGKTGGGRESGLLHKNNYFNRSGLSLH